VRFKEGVKDFGTRVARRGEAKTITRDQTRSLTTVPNNPFNERENITHLSGKVNTSRPMNKIK